MTKRDKFNPLFEQWVTNWITSDKLAELDNYLITILKLRFIEIIDEKAINIISIDDKNYFAEIMCEGNKVVIAPTDLVNATIQAVNRYKDMFNQNY